MFNYYTALKNTKYFVTAEIVLKTCSQNMSTGYYYHNSRSKIPCYVRYSIYRYITLIFLFSGEKISCTCKSNKKLKEKW